MQLTLPLLLVLLFSQSMSLHAADDEFVGLPQPGELKDFLREKQAVPVNEEKSTEAGKQKAVKNRKSSVNNKKTTEAYKKDKAQTKNRSRPVAVRAAGVLKVGKGEKYSLPSQAAKVAVDGDVIEIDANGDYSSDTVIWKSSSLLIKGVNGRPHITSNKRISNGKGLWVIKGDNVTVENIEFSHARVYDKNGAGIRQEGKNLTVRYCYFHDNQNGILAGQSKDSKILLEYNEFAYNGAGDGRSHNMYIGAIDELTVRFNYIHHAKIGHNVKTRARNNYISYNRIMDEKEGNASYQVDIPNGGMAYLIGNSIQQGENADNWALISYGVEGIKYPQNELVLVNNTLVNDRHSGMFITSKGDIDIMMINNIFAGRGRLPDYRSVKATNLVKTTPRFKNRQQYDFHLTAGSDAIDKGSFPVRYNGVKLRAEYEYVHKSRAGIRQTINQPDYGAFEFVP